MKIFFILFLQCFLYTRSTGELFQYGVNPRSSIIEEKVSKEQLKNAPQHLNLAHGPVALKPLDELEESPPLLRRKRQEKVKKLSKQKLNQIYFQRRKKKFSVKAQIRKSISRRGFFTEGTTWRNVMKRYVRGEGKVVRSAKGRLAKKNIGNRFKKNQEVACDPEFFKTRSEGRAFKSGGKFDNKNENQQRGEYQRKDAYRYPNYQRPQQRREREQDAYEFDSSPRKEKRRGNDRGADKFDRNQRQEKRREYDRGADKFDRSQRPQRRKEYDRGSDQSDRSQRPQRRKEYDRGSDRSDRSQRPQRRKEYDRGSDRSDRSQRPQKRKEYDRGADKSGKEPRRKRKEYKDTTPILYERPLDLDQELNRFYSKNPKEKQNLVTWYLTRKDRGRFRTMANIPSDEDRSEMMKFIPSTRGPYTTGKKTYSFLEEVEGQRLDQDKREREYKWLMYEAHEATRFAFLTKKNKKTTPLPPPKKVHSDEYMYEYKDASGCVVENYKPKTSMGLAKESTKQITTSSQVKKKQTTLLSQDSDDYYEDDDDQGSDKKVPSHPSDTEDHSAHSPAAKHRSEPLGSKGMPGAESTNKNKSLGNNNDSYISSDSLDSDVKEYSYKDFKSLLAESSLSKSKRKKTTKKPDGEESELEYLDDSEDEKEDKSPKKKTTPTTKSHHGKGAKPVKGKPIKKPVSVEEENSDDKGLEYFKPIKKLDNDKELKPKKKKPSKKHDSDEEESDYDDDEDSSGDGPYGGEIYKDSVEENGSSYDESSYRDSEDKTKSSNDEPSYKETDDEQFESSLFYESDESSSDESNLHYDNSLNSGIERSKYTQKKTTRRRGTVPDIDYLGITVKSKPKLTTQKKDTIAQSHIKITTKTTTSLASRTSQPANTLPSHVPEVSSTNLQITSHLTTVSKKPSSPPLTTSTVQSVDSKIFTDESLTTPKTTRKARPRLPKTSTQCPQSIDKSLGGVELTSESSTITKITRKPRTRKPKTTVSPNPQT